MNTIWKAVIGLSALIVAANCLDCRQCSVGVFGSCFFGSDVTCNNATASCYTGEAQFNATGGVSLHTRGCLDSDLCNKTLTGSFIGAAYTSSFKCCTTNLCNSGTSAQLSLTVALFTAALSSLRSFWEL
ncbi:uncharacterized protein V3H82_019264 [Fundulus diaphanus]